MFRHDHSSSTVKVAGATRIPKSLPHSQDVTQFRLGTRSNFWEFGDERLPFSEHTLNRRLLKHDFADQDLPWVSLIAPWQLTQSWSDPGEDSCVQIVTNGRVIRQ